jgi:hypothetical protein
MVDHSSACTNGFAISSLPSTGLTSTNSVPLATTSPSGLVDVLPSSSAFHQSLSGLFKLFPLLSLLLLPFSLAVGIGDKPRTTSSTSSSTRFINASYPFNVPVTSRPPVNLTQIFLSMYFPKSRIFSFFGRSRSPPEWPPRPSCPPPLGPPRPRCSPRGES